MGTVRCSSPSMIAQQLLESWIGLRTLRAVEDEACELLPNTFQFLMRSACDISSP